MPRRPLDPVPSARAIAVLSRSRDRPARVGGGPEGPPVDPEWVRRPPEPFVPTREEVAAPAQGAAVAARRRSGPPGGIGPEGAAAPRRMPWAGLLTVPTALRDVRWVPSRAAVTGALAVVLLAIGVFGVRVAWARVDGGSTPVSAAPMASVIPAPGASPSPAGSATVGTASGDAAPTTGQLVVHVVGRVRHPGIVTLPPGSRVVDAVGAAGGAAKGADLSAINLARLVVDGEQIRVPRPGEVVAGTSGGAAGGSSGAGGPVSLNTADVTALDTLPGIGPVLAQRIVDWRTENGRFTSIDELGEVSGIGEKLLAQLRSKVTL